MEHHVLVQSIVIGLQNTRAAHDVSQVNMIKGDKFFDNKCKEESDSGI